MSSLARLPLQGEWSSPFSDTLYFGISLCFSVTHFGFLYTVGFFFKLFTDLHKNKKKLVEVVWDMVVEFSPAFLFC